MKKNTRQAGFISNLILMDFQYLTGKKSQFGRNNFKTS